MTAPFADRLLAACRAKGNALCMGIDPRWDMLPREIRLRHDGGTLDAAAAFAEFGLRVLDLVAPHVAAVQPQSAFSEACGPRFACYGSLIPCAFAVSTSCDQVVASISMPSRERCALVRFSISPGIRMSPVGVVFAELFT